MVSTVLVPADQFNTIPSGRFVQTTFGRAKLLNPIKRGGSSTAESASGFPTTIRFNEIIAVEVPREEPLAQVELEKGGLAISDGVVGPAGVVSQVEEIEARRERIAAEPEVPVTQVVSRRPALAGTPPKRIDIKRQAIGLGSSFAGVTFPEPSRITRPLTQTRVVDAPPPEIDTFPARQLRQRLKEEQERLEGIEKAERELRESQIAIRGAPEGSEFILGEGKEAVTLTQKESLELIGSQQTALKEISRPKVTPIAFTRRPQFALPKAEKIEKRPDLELKLPTEQEFFISKRVSIIEKADDPFTGIVGGFGIGAVETGIEFAKVPAKVAKDPIGGIAEIATGTLLFPLTATFSLVRRPTPRTVGQIVGAITISKGIAKVAGTGIRAIKTTRVKPVSEFEVFRLRGIKTKGIKIDLQKSRLIKTDTFIKKQITKTVEAKRVFIGEKDLGNLIRTGLSGRRPKPRVIKGTEGPTQFLRKIQADVKPVGKTIFTTKKPPSVGLVEFRGKVTKTTTGIAGVSSGGQLSAKGALQTIRGKFRPFKPPIPPSFTRPLIPAKITKTPFSKTFEPVKAITPTKVPTTTGLVTKTKLAPAPKPKVQTVDVLLGGKSTFKFVSTPRVKTFPGLIGFPSQIRTFPGVRRKSGFDLIGAQRPVSRLDLDTRQRLRVVAPTKEINILATPTRADVRTGQAVIQGLTFGVVTPIPKTPFVRTPFAPLRPPKTPRITTTIFPFEEDLFKKKATKLKKLFGKQKKKFTPSLTAAVFDIRGKKPKRLIGTEIRPLLI